MSENSLTALWSTIAPALANHLWQSTLVVAAAGLLTLALRKHHARARHWLWLAASIKFLVPFSLFVAIGSHLSWQRHSAATSGSGMYMIEELSRPFTQAATRVNSANGTSIGTASLPHLLPILTALWFIGFLAVLLVWTTRWRRIASAMKSAVPLSDGREVGALRRMERMGGIRRPIALLLAQTSLEPGVFGIARPTLIWPEGISKRLEDPHLEAVLAHEVWHVRRRDNLFAALHMLVEAAFWFYPWSGGWERASSTSANAPAMKKSSPSAVIARSMPKAF